MMSKEQFTKELVNELTKRLDANYSVHSQSVRKNNGILLEAVVIRKEHQMICPTIYIDGYFHEYCDGQKDISFIACEIINVFHSHSKYTDSQFLDEFHKKPLNVKCKLINTEANRILLDTVPHKEWNDLSIVYYLELGADDDGKRTVTITNWLMEVLGLNFEELDRLATVNMQNFNPCIESMSTVIHRLLGMDDMLDSAEDNDRMYVISNEEKVNGAISILHKDILKNFATLKNIEKIWILPSSIHEMILVLDDGTMCADTFNHMVQEVNETEVDSLEVLSSNCYIYNRLTDSFSVA